VVVYWGLFVLGVRACVRRAGYVQGYVYFIAVTEKFDEA
jgi:hypothetical protein